MNSLVIYSSAYGNTAAIANTIRASLSKYGSAEVADSRDLDFYELPNIDLVVVGSPTQGGRPTEAIEQVVQDLPPNLFHHALFGVFDTRLEAKEQNSGLRLLMKLIGYAAPKLAKAIEKRGGVLIAPPVGFVVHGKEGPIEDGELKLAARWAQGIAQGYNYH